MSLIKYYCPNCKNIGISEVNLDKDVIWNPRDMYGYPLLHFPCPKCGSLNNASMIKLWTQNLDKEDKHLDEYVMYTIDLYGIDDYGDNWRAFLKKQWENKMKNNS